MESKSERSKVLVVTDDANYAASTLNSIWEFENEDPKCFDPLIIMQASLARLPLESSYVDLVIFISRSVEFPVDELLSEIFRVLMPGGKLVVYRSSQSRNNEGDRVMSAVEGKLLFAGFVEGERFQLKSVAQSFGCGLGDAFRCSTCPYKGLPAFKLGEKVSLSGNFLTADI